MKMTMMLLFCVICCILAISHIPDSAAKSIAPLSGSGMKCDATFFVPSERVLEMLHERKGIVIIDVRQKNDFDRFRIPGSLNIPLYAIKTKTFLKSKALILVNEGHQVSQLEQECRHLRQSGFNVRILKGGFNSWKRQGGITEGENIAHNKLNRISSLNYFYEKDRGDWVVINASPSRNSVTGSLSASNVSIPFEGDGNKFIAGFRRYVADVKINPCTRVLVFDEKGDIYGRIEQALQKTGIDILFLEGGIQAYRKVAEHQNAVGRNLPVYRKSYNRKCATCR
jgi:rhodanese-related sulfurtransferase